MPAKGTGFHGQGGQGALMATKILKSAATKVGKCDASFPMYSFDRRGMPVIAFTRRKYLKPQYQPIERLLLLYLAHNPVILGNTEKYA